MARVGEWRSNVNAGGNCGTGCQTLTDTICKKMVVIRVLVFFLCRRSLVFDAMKLFLKILSPALTFCVICMAGLARAHASEGGFVLLLPTDFYITAGVASVALTVVLLVILPDRATRLLFTPIPILRVPRMQIMSWTSGLSALCLIALVIAGTYGARDPLRNPMPLFVWTVWWISLVSVQGLVWDHWRWTNPWTGPGKLLSWLTGERALLRYPRRLGYIPGIVGFLAFAGFLLADPAPADPARLATCVGGYWLFNLAGLALFGPAWMVRAEAITILMRAYGRMAILGRSNGRMSVGLPGWQLMRAHSVPLGLGAFILLMLGAGSFDGLNETFWWFGVLDLNPLEFPGRSAIIAETLGGLIIANGFLVLMFVASIWLGVKWAGSNVGLTTAIRVFAPSILPIALGYHIAHYLTTLLVDGQYVLVALSDPFNTGADYLRLGAHSVTTGFLNTAGTVRAIWLTQAGTVVVGHVIAILLAHGLALRVFGTARRAVISQAPLAIFMVAYTFFGLWLLASPRGL